MKLCSAKQNITQSWIKNFASAPENNAFPKTLLKTLILCLCISSTFSSATQGTRKCGEVLVDAIRYMCLERTMSTHEERK